MENRIPTSPKIVFFDIDDTIYRKYTDTLRPSVFRAMAALKSRGILTAIATGRSPAALPDKVKMLIAETGIDMLVTINGQYTTFRGEVLQAYPLDMAGMEKMCAFFDRQGIAYAFVNHNEIAVSEATPRVREALSHIVAGFVCDKDYFYKKPVYQMLVFADAAEEKAIAGKVAAEGFKLVRWHETAVDMLRPEGSKARGIAHALDVLGIPINEAAAFGDGLNDVEMLSAVGLGVAMGNGADEAKAAADFVCPSVDEDGVWRGLLALGIIDDAQQAV